MKTIAFLLLFFAQVTCFASEDTNIVAAGDWSTPVAGLQDKTTGRGAHHPILSGRLLLCKSPKNHQLAMYLELQDSGDTWGTSVEVYCNMRGGCHLEIRDTSGKPITPQGSAFGGGTPGSEWITMPCDSTVRLRISAYASFSFASTSDYLVSGTFVVDPPVDADHAGLDVWQGTLKLPAMTVVPHKP